MRVVYTNANIIDGVHDHEIRNGYVVVNQETGKIEEVGNRPFHSDELAQVKAIDLEGAWILPGLINCHTHIMRDGSPDPDTFIKGESMEMITLHALRNAQRHLVLGVTTIRDVGSPGLTTLAVKKAIQLGLHEGPNVYTSGTPLIMTGGHFRMGKEVDGEDEVRKATRQLLKNHVDVVKLFATGGIYSKGEEPGSPQLTLQEIKVAVEEAHKKNVPVATHAQGLEGILNSLEAGVDTIEHAIYADDRALEMFVEKGTVLVPTMVAMTRIAEGEKYGIPQYAVEKAKRVAEIHFSMLEKAVKYGVKIATGTDAGSPCNPPEEIFAELEVMRSAGMSEMQIIKSTTSIAAEAIRAENVGRIQEGYLADLVILESNPLEDISRLRNQKLVLKAGKSVHLKK
ncbi:metal-dependent hydrolase family protein [Brevibacillus sp. H7]|uniref:metal-dependent hydrolase family protein n=1 Tax=Brevibacillus sp. H7 TaxID=3349138 RepID=UPI00382D5C0F